MALIPFNLPTHSVILDDSRLAMSERALLEAVTGLATALGWHHYHTHNSRRSDAGFPDLVLWRERVIFVELKSTKGKVSNAQVETLHGLAHADARVFVWRPADWITGRVERELRQQ